MSDMYEVMPLATLATSNKLGVVGGASEQPVTSEPKLSNQRDSQLPLKPVCPVKNTRFARQKSALTTIPSKELFHFAKVLQGKFCLARCPWAAKSHGAEKQPNCLL